MNGPATDDVYLCQVDETISCGACCGLYNVADPTREGLTVLLARRTERFHAAPRNLEGLLAFAGETSRVEPGARPYPEFHHCPYVGLVGDRRDRAGCLLHPLGAGNEGIDYRGLSYYGGMACRDYFCLSCKTLPARWKRLVCSAAGDWHRFGLMITEADLLRAFFSEVERRAGCAIAISNDDAPIPVDLVRAVSAFIDLRVDWPFRPTDIPVANYFFEDRRYERPPVWYHKLDAGPSGHDDLLRELGTAFSGPADRTRAEALLDQCIENAATALHRRAASPMSTAINQNRKEPTP